MFARLFPPSLETHDLVTTAVRRGANPDLTMLSEPLELLCRDLDGPARLHAEGRRRARQRLLDALRHAPNPSASGDRAASPTTNTAPVVVIAGLPGPRHTALVDAVRSSASPTSGQHHEDTALESLLRSMAFDVAWHAPQWAEWFESTDHRDALSRLHNTANDRPTVLTHWQHLERLDEVIEGSRATIVLVDQPVGEVVENWVPYCIEQRRRWSNEVDPERVARYWSWRLTHVYERGVALLDQLPGVLRLDHTFIDQHVDEAARQVTDLIDDIAGR